MGSLVEFGEKAVFIFREVSRQGEVVGCVIAAEYAGFGRVNVLEHQARLCDDLLGFQKFKLATLNLLGERSARVEHQRQESNV